MIFSIIVPVYNTEDYLKQCVESIITQSFKDFELILVNDGSRDSSPIICDAYAALDHRIHVVHKLNGGLSDARNSGITRAVGEYLIFLDSDDFFEMDCLSRAANRLIENPVDILFGSFNDYDTDTNIKDYRPFYFDSHLMVLGQPYAILADLFQANQAVVWGTCRHIFRRSFINDMNLHFDVETMAAEDCDFFFKSVLKASSFAGESRPLFNYRLSREGSLMTQPSTRVLHDKVYILLKWMDKMKETPQINKAFVHKIIPVLARELCEVVPQLLYASMNKDDAFQHLELRRRELFSADSFRLKIKALMFIIFGFHVGQKLIYALSFIKHPFYKQ